jgi:hypothetical protein
LNNLEYNYAELAYPAVVIFGFTLVVAFLVTRSVIGSLAGALIKAGLFFLNYWLFFKGQVTGFDDLYYLETASKLRGMDFVIMDVFQRRQEVMALAEGAHIFYPIYNYYGVALFGDFYFAPVALNVLLTLPVAYIGMRLSMSEFGLSRRQARLFFFFIFLHPEILAWSTVFNGKETLVLLCHVVFLSGASLFFRGRILVSLIVITPAIFILSGLRYYTPPLFAAAFMVYSLIAVKGKYRVTLVLLGLTCTGLLLMNLWGIGLIYSLNVFVSTFNNPLIGFVHFLMCPRPFFTDPEYEFLNWPSVYHWLAFPLLVLGFARVYRIKTRFSRYLIIYFATIMAFYSSFSELQGARHRYQLLFAFAIFEFFGASVLIKSFRTWWRKRGKPAPTVLTADGLV